MNVRKSVRVLCGTHDITQSELAEIAGMTIGGFSRAVRNGTIQINKIKKICAHFEIKVSEFARLGE